MMVKLMIQVATTELKA